MSSAGDKEMKYELKRCRDVWFSVRMCFYSVYYERKYVIFLLEDELLSISAFSNASTIS